jgi:mannose-6-phosphate isomerase-like protein (cupin superfamily)
MRYGGAEEAENRCRRRVVGRRWSPRSIAQIRGRIMNRTIAASMFLLSTTLTIAADDAKVSFFDQDEVAKGGTFVTAPNFSVTVARRTEPGMVEVHDKETDTFYVLDGAATIVTGGKMIGGSQTGPGQHRGTDIEGGQAQQLTQGDVMVIPAGVPHWFKDVPSSIEYYVVKVIAP